jgi:uncharacterized protein
MERKHLFEGSGNFVTSALTRLGIMGGHPSTLEEPLPAEPGPGPGLLSATERASLLNVAREVLGNPSRELKEFEPAEPAENLKAHRASFVTLVKAGVLRGCMGNIFPECELFKSVIRNARAAAFRDPRFPPVEPPELPEIRIEISVLTKPERVKATGPEQILESLRPHEDGVLLRVGPRYATFLPQVWRHIPDRLDFLERLCEKAGCDPLIWREADARVYVYQVESFHEPDAPVLQP